MTLQPIACALPDYSTDGAAIQKLEFPYRRSKDQDAGNTSTHPVVVVGAGPVGLTLAIDLAQRGQRVVLLDNDNRLSSGSRAICFAKKTLEVWDRLDVGDAMCAKGVGWNAGRVFLGSEELYRFDLLPEQGHRRPAFINLQQYYAEAYLCARAEQLPGLEIRWKNEVVGVVEHEDGVHVTIRTPEGDYEIVAGWLAACDGSRSAVRRLLGLESSGRVFQDRFLIADVRMEVDFPAERWFWFDPPFHRNQSVLLHRQPDGVWRIDFQLGWDADPEEEKRLERVKPRIDAMMRQALGREVPFELEWSSVYTFSCLRMEKFRHGRVLFAGDAAHGVSPFGARGANSGVQDAENLAWKLDAVLRGVSPDKLLDSYAREREVAADDNILNSTRATDFITPKSEVSRLFRDAVLQLSKHYPFARSLVNSGRLSLPTLLRASELNTPDEGSFNGDMEPGATASDAPVRLPDGQSSWLLRHLGDNFTLLLSPGAHCERLLAELSDSAVCGLDVLLVGTDPAPGPVHLVDLEGLVAKRYDLLPGSGVLIRPDHHVCARWRAPSLLSVRDAVSRALLR